MADQATQEIAIAAPPERCWEVLVDFERYPRWARDVKEATVVRRDEQGRAEEVAFRVAALGRSARYTLRYDYSGAPGRLAWDLIESDIMRRLDGAYELTGDGARTDVTYHLAVDLVIPLPGFVKRRAEGRIMSAALESLRDEAEAGSTP